MHTHFINSSTHRFAITKISMLGSSEPGNDASFANDVFQ